VTLFSILRHILLNTFIQSYSTFKVIDVNHCFLLWNEIINGLVNKFYIFFEFYSWTIRLITFFNCQSNSDVKWGLEFRLHCLRFWLLIDLEITLLIKQILLLLHHYRLELVPFFKWYLCLFSLSFNIFLLFFSFPTVFEADSNSC